MKTKNISKVMCRLFVVFVWAITLSYVCALSAQANPVDLAGKKIAVLLGEGFQDEEALYPKGFFTNRRAEITVIGVKDGYVKAYNSDVEIRIDKLAQDVDAGVYDAIIIPGGKSPAYLKDYPVITEFIKTGSAEGKVIAAICHGPLLLIEADLVEGKSVAAYPDITDQLYSAGASYADVPVSRTGKMITSRNPNDLPHFVNAIEQALSKQ